MSDNDEREGFRRDWDGRLTLWGARDALLHLVDGALGDAWAAGAESLDDVRAAYARRLDGALDDLEEAVLRTHDQFGCAEGIAEDEGRFICRACKNAQDATRDVEARFTKFDDLRRGLANPSRTVVSGRALVDAERAEIDALNRADAGYTEYAKSRDGEDLSVEKARGRRIRTDEDVARGFDEAERGDAEQNDALVMAARQRREVITQRIRAGLPEEPPEGWDAVADIQRERGRAARDENTSGEVESNGR